MRDRAEHTKFVMNGRKEVGRTGVAGLRILIVRGSEKRLQGGKDVCF